MDIYLAGGYNGNLKYLWRSALDALTKGGDYMDIYLAGANLGRRWVLDEYIKENCNEYLSSGSNSVGGRELYPYP